MKATLIGLVAVTVGLLALAWSRGDDTLSRGLSTSASQFGRFLPVLVVAFLIMGLVDALLPEKLVETWLSDASGWRGLGIAWLAGLLTPGGSIIGMPLAAGLAKAGVGPGVLVTYLTSLAVLSVIRVPLEVGFYGWRLMLLRVLASLVLPLVAGLVARWLAPWVMGG